MWMTIIIAILFIIAVVAFVIGKFSREFRGEAIIAGIIAAIIGLIVLTFSAVTIVSTRNVGIVTTFGRPNGELSNGLHWVAPWQEVTEMDGAIQLEKFEKDSNNSMTVRLGNNSTADANVTIQWRLNPDATPGLFLDYRTFDNIRDNLVNKELQVAMNTEFAKFDPLAPGQSDGAPLVAISDQVQKDVQGAVGSRIEIQKVFVPLISYDGPTQDRINALNIEKANTRVAEQSAKTADAQAKANEILAGSVSNDPNVIVANCITTALQKGMSPYGCWPGATAIPTMPLPGVK